MTPTPTAAPGASGPTVEDLGPASSPSARAVRAGRDLRRRRGDETPYAPDVVVDRIEVSVEEALVSKILVVYGTRDGSAREVASVVTGELTAAGHSVQLVTCAAAPATHHYDAVVVGSDIHHRHWLPDATGYLKHQAPDLSERPTFLYECGPVAPAPRFQQADDRADSAVPRAVRTLAWAIGTAPPVTFPTHASPAQQRSQSRLWAAHIVRSLDSVTADAPVASNLRT